MDFLTILKRRHFLSAGALAALPLPLSGQEKPAAPSRPNRIGVSSYSF